MTGNPGWYPPAQVSHPPDLPTYLKNVCHLKPIVGLPTDDEVMGIHAVMQAARKGSEIPGMHDPGLLVNLSDHLFNAQMARYRSKYSLITFPSDATYTPPTLPAHIPTHLGPVSGAPTDDEMAKVQDSLRSYQQFSHAPSMFDPRVNMELSQHLFDLQMARYMRCAGEAQPRPITQTEGQVQTLDPSLNTADKITTTNNAGTGADPTGISPMVDLPSSIDVRESTERSNQLLERLNQLLERSNELVEKYSQPSDQSNSLSERFNQVFERFTQFVERTRQPTEQPDHLTERFNILLERSNQLVEQSVKPAHRANELAERSNELAERANQLAEQHYRSTERSNQLAEQAIKHTDDMKGCMKNINKILMGIQHGIVRSYKGNTIHAVDCLVNEKGQTPIEGLGVSGIVLSSTRY